MKLHLKAQNSDYLQIYNLGRIVQGNKYFWLVIYVLNVILTSSNNKEDKMSDLSVTDVVIDVFLVISSSFSLYPEHFQERNSH